MWLDFQVLENQGEREWTLAFNCCASLLG